MHSRMENMCWSKSRWPCSAEDGAQIARAVAKSDAKVMIGQGYRFMDSATILRQAFQSGNDR